MSRNARGCYAPLYAGCALLALALAAGQARAVNVTLDYTYDTTNFFGAGNPSGATAGAQARAALEAVANFYSDILDDTFSAIQTPPNYSSQTFNGVAFWTWSLNFTHPVTAGTVTLQNQVIGANEYRIYAGARNVGGTTLGIGGPGGYNYSSSNNGGGFTQAEVNQISAITDAFEDDIVRREEASGFARWGGVITFDSAGTVWHYNHNTAPAGSANDFYSVAIHELGHALGLGASSNWSAFISGGVFTGPASMAEYGSSPPATTGHWASGTMSRIYGTNTPQEAALDPEITTGTRKRLTALDAAGLTDIGWDVAAPATYDTADFNEDTFVNGADLVLWRAAFDNTANADADGDGDSDGADFLAWQRQLGGTSLTPAAVGAGAVVPEPPGALLAACAAAAMWRRGRRRSARGAR